MALETIDALDKAKDDANVRAILLPAKGGQRWLILAGASLMLSACDCIQQVDGVVMDQHRAQPIDDVEIFERSADGTYDKTYFTTDMGGRFEFNGISGGPCGCPDVQLHFSNPGYLPLDKVYPATSSGETIWLDMADF
jgi:hypothetical protein